MLLLLLFLPTLAARHADLVKDLPGLIFEPDFRTFSGYLYGNADRTMHLHYMLFESRSDPAVDPVIFWFNGGPLCSSMIGGFVGAGPFLPLPGGDGLFENIFSWNKRANLVLLESPMGVGFNFANFSLRDPSEDLFNDHSTVDMNEKALKDFFTRVHPQLRNNPFFLAGESYAAVYISQLAWELTKMLNRKEFPNVNFKGISIGNGGLATSMYVYSKLIYNVYHGYFPFDVWVTMKAKCNVSEENLYEATPAQLECMEFRVDWERRKYIYGGYDVEMGYHTGKGCYAPRIHDKFLEDPSENPADYFATYSTDNQRGLPCWFSEHPDLMNDNILTEYFSKDEVQAALNIPVEFRKKFEFCNNEFFQEYRETKDTSETFAAIIKHFQGEFRIMIYNGDMDAACSFITSAWFLRRLAKMEKLNVTRKHAPWYYRDMKNPSGYTQRYANSNGRVTIDFLTVKGGSHSTVMDRPGQTHQIMSNFIHSGNMEKVNYSSSDLMEFDPATIPLRPKEGDCGRGWIPCVVLVFIVISTAIILRYKIPAPTSTFFL